VEKASVFVPALSETESMSSPPVSAVVDKVSKNLQSRLAALFRVKLRAEHVSLFISDNGWEIDIIIAGGDDRRRVVRHSII
jgi:hypothetical protein